MPSWKDDYPKIETVKLLVVGAGGIGCELLKNLAGTGFRNVHVIDLDTIDISNLNRQFLFRKEHVSSSKAEIATKIVKQFCPNINLTYDHDSIFESKFGIDFFKSFDMVLNALDNRGARNHVNRMCYAANRHLIESGSSGYFGQVQVIMRGKTECYECQDKPKQKTFPGCTIRNTPSEHIHCTVWAKHVFNQLFGEIDIDDDVSPDMQAVDPENPDSSTQEEREEEVADTPAPVGTRQWAESVNYDAEKIFDKLFTQDIVYLCKMSHLWKQRKQPIPLTYASALTQGDAYSFQAAQNKSTSVWTVATCANVFATCIKELLDELKKNDQTPLSFEKDHPVIMSFVAACANIRAHIFSIQTKSLFDIKAMAGNIIPAIASTNAIVAGMMVTECVKMISGQEADAKCSFLRNTPNPRGKIFAEQEPFKPNPKCYICADVRSVYLYVNPDEMTVGGLCEKVLKQELNMIAPDVVHGGTFNMIISSDPEDKMDEMLTKKLSEVSIENGAILNCDDYMQELELKLFIRSADHLKGDQFEVAREDTDDKKKEEAAAEVPMDVSQEAPEAPAEVPMDVAQEAPEAPEAKKRKVEGGEQEEEGPEAKRLRTEEQHPL
ncbi:unnamed protein product [Caenorhabditis brenneri]